MAKQIKIRLTDDAAKYILEKTCTDRSYGARPLRRALQKYIEDPLSEASDSRSRSRGRPSSRCTWAKAGLYCRQLQEQPEPVAVLGDGTQVEEAPAPAPAGMPLYIFD